MPQKTMLRNKNIKTILKGMIDKDITSYRELGRRLNYSNATVNRWFTGRLGIPMETIEKIEILLDIELDLEEMKKDLKGWWYLC